MFGMNTDLTYALLTIKSIGKRSFVAMGKIINKSGDTVKRLMNSSEENCTMMAKIATTFFHGKKELVLTIDDTLVKKVHSSLMCGSGWFYDTKIGRKIIAYKLLCSAISDGRYHCHLGVYFCLIKSFYAVKLYRKMVW